MNKRIYQMLLLSLIFFLAIFSFFDNQGTARVLAQDGVTNPDLRLTAIDDTDVFTTVNPGQPTVIIFGKTNCSITQGTVKDIASSEWIGSGAIRVIFAECNSASLEETKAFGQTYGCENMFFCYDTSGYLNNRAWNDYCDIGMELGVNIGSLPTTVLIDGNNCVQKVLSGRQSAASIYAALQGSSGGNIGGTTEDTVTVQVQGTEGYAYASEILVLVNQARAAEGLAPLQLDETLLDVAMQRAAEISLYYSHTRPDGTKCFTASDRGTRKTENIAVGYSTPKAVMDAWMGSEGHHANIMDQDVTSIGIGCFQDSQGVWNWVQFFDNEAASGTVKTEDGQAVRSVAIKKSFLHLQTEGEKTFAESEINQQVSMNIYQCNEEFAQSRPKLLNTNFTFQSSMSSVAEVNDQGIITVKGSGDAVITASLKSDSAITVELSVKVAGSQASSSPEITLPPVHTSAPTATASAMPSPTGEQKPTSSPSALPSPTGMGTTAPGTVISNVSKLKAGSGKNSIKLSWGAVSQAEGYLLYQYHSQKKAWNQIATVKAGKVSYTVKKLNAATGYRFAVKAYLVKDGKTVTSKLYTSVYTATKPGNVNFRISAKKGKAVLKWSKVKGATGYEVYYKTEKKGSWKRLKRVKKTSFTTKKFKSGSRYFFTVKAYKSSKGKMYTGSGNTKKILL